MDEYVEDKNAYRTRHNKHSHLPTNVPADVAYYCPEKYGGERGLIPIPDHIIQSMMDLFYPDVEELFQFCEPDFLKIVEAIATEEGIIMGDLDLVSVWEAFAKILTRLQELGVEPTLNQ